MQEATQKIYDGKMNTMKNELVALRNQLASNNLEQEKIKKVCKMKFDVKWKSILNQITKDKENYHLEFF